MQCHSKLKAGLEEWYERMEQERVERKLAFEKSLEIMQDDLNQYTTSCKSLKIFVEHMLKTDTEFQPLTMYADLLARMSTLEKSMTDIEQINEVNMVKFSVDESCFSSLSLPNCWEEERLEISFGVREVTLSQSSSSSSDLTSSLQT